jgi:hypothetical protein
MLFFFAAEREAGISERRRGNDAWRFAARQHARKGKPPPVGTAEEKGFGCIFRRAGLPAGFLREADAERKLGL